jgi:L-ascorbate metabolism protein UlaG (beta-lactamase superfamily)
MLEKVHWLGHACIKILGNKVIYVDPYEISGGEIADIIMITHDHYDHFSLEDIRKVSSDSTVFIGPKSVAKSLKGNVKTVQIGDHLTVEGIDIEVIPAYNIDKQFHSKEKNYTGYVFIADGVTYYHTGDSDVIPEMKSIRADVVFIPVGGTYTMNAEEAADLINDIKPAIAVPIHYGKIIGSGKDAETFRANCKSDVRILKQE